MALMNGLFLTNQSNDIQSTVKLTHELVISISVSESYTVIGFMTSQEVKDNV